jgi:DNA-binding NtrC family response regulator
MMTGTMSETPEYVNLNTEPSRRILVVDPDPDTSEMVRRSLGADALVVVDSARDWPTAMQKIGETLPNMMLVDLQMAGIPGLQILDSIIEIDPGLDVIPMSSFYSTDMAVEAIQKGAYDFVVKPLAIERFRNKLNRWMEDARVRRRTLRLDHELLEAYQFEGIVGRSVAMLDVFARMRRIGPHFQTLLITGETGTGKELVARALHRLSPSSHGPFVVCSCTSIPEPAFEAELFGRAASAGQLEKPGLLEQAANGVLFLDEVADLPGQVQAKLVRMLQNREFHRVGEPMPRYCEARVVAASSRNLHDMVQHRRFREDLYYRLATAEIKLPRLAERPDDVALLERHFLRQFAARYGKPSFHLTRRAQNLLARYNWPGNVREIENVLGYCAMMADRNLIDVRDLPESIRTYAASQRRNEELLTIEELQRRHAQRVLEYTGGNRVRASEILGISRATLYRLLARAAKSGQ